jgi:thioredoxin 1
VKLGKKKKNFPVLIFIMGILAVLGMDRIADWGGQLVGLEISSDCVFAQTTSEPVTNTDQDLKIALISGKPVLVDFGSNKCIPCRQLRPILKEVEKELAGKAHVLVIDVYNFGRFAREYRVQLIPTLIFFNTSGKEIFRRMGVWDKDSIVKKLKEGGTS